MNVIYSFIGKLPNYIIETIYQLRLYYDGDVYLIIDDIKSQYLKDIVKFNIKIIKYEDVIDNEFNNLNKNKIEIVNNLGDRELLFIKSFERFYLLKNLMKKYNLKNCLFLELDNLIYDNPNNWLKLFSKDKLNAMYHNSSKCKHISTGLCFIYKFEILEPILEYYNNFIKTSTTFISEMVANYNYHIETSNLNLLPIHWTDNNVNKMAYENIDLFNNSLFDALSIGVYLCGFDKVHTNNQIKLYQKNHFCDIDFTKYKIYWKITNGLKKPYIQDNNNNEYLINNLHVHSKDLKLGLSKPI